ncbi:PKS-like enzyme [Aspergillus flavus]|nr:PKS-like enzyme [Aspergillus flavus]RAQ69108.1 PKS-like enzyme [Aspergillus flavus]
MPSAHTTVDVPIAVVGLACRFPGDASSPSKFWDMLKNGKDAYSPTSTRWNSDAFYHPGGDRSNVLPTKGGHLLREDPYVFDAAFFNITAAEAIALDPKQWIAMEVTYEACENAGMSLQRISGTQTACYIGSGASDNRGAVERDFLHNPKYHLLGTGDEMISNRISHFFNIHGPKRHGADRLLVQFYGYPSGLLKLEDFTTHLNNLNFLKPEGRSKAFDESAGGYGRGEGCGIIILKRLADAIQEGDDIRAAIRATGANSDGFTQVGKYALVSTAHDMPSLEAQTALINTYTRTTGLTTRHNTSKHTTKAGDPIETKAIHSTIGKGSSKSRKLLIGSAKPNIGHLESAAGVSEIIKGILSMEHNLRWTSRLMFLEMLELSSNIYTFDSTLSKLNLSVIDFRVSELENDTGEQESQQLEVDPAEITSEVRWNYALEVLEPDEIKRVVSTVAAEDRAVELIRLYLHNNSAATVIELAPHYEALNHATMSLLPRGTIPSSHIKYAVAGTGKESEEQGASTNVIGKPFDLGDSDDPLPADIAAADLLVVPLSISNHKDLGVLLRRFSSLGKPDASLVLAMDSSLNVSAAILEAEGFERIFDVQTLVALYKKRQTEHANGPTNGYTKGTSTKFALVIGEPPATTSGSSSFCCALQATLRDHSYTVLVTTWAKISDSAATDLEGNIFISLLELEQPLLDTLSEPDFHSVRKLLLNSDRLLWITAGNNASMGVVDGIRRTVRSEVAGLKFEVLHLSNLETAL